jgi:hypothetical protein
VAAQQRHAAEDAVVVADQFVEIVIVARRVRFFVRGPDGNE